MASVSTAAASQFDQDTFLQLLIAQVQNQNPLDPVSDTEFIAQLAQFNTLSGIQQLNTTFSQMLRLQQLTDGSQLIGRTVNYTDATGQPATGRVAQVVANGSDIFLDLGGPRITLDQVSAVL